MPLLLSQLVYTSFLKVGFKLLASEQVPIQIQQAFLNRVAHLHWDSYNPPRFGYRAVYLHQVTLEHSLFGWFYNDGADEMGRSPIPYFICYYLPQKLHTIQLENIFTFLYGGPVSLIDRQIPTALETIVAPDLWSYQPARTGVTIPLEIRERSYLALERGQVLDIFVPAPERKILAELNAPTCERLTQALCKHIGPMGEVIVRQVVARSAHLRNPYQQALQVCRELVAEVEPHVVPSFQTEVKRLLNLSS